MVEDFSPLTIFIKGSILDGFQGPKRVAAFAVSCGFGQIYWRNP